MEYSTGQQIKVGDEVVADGMTGVVICDFDNREVLDGYESWLVPPNVEMVGGGTFSGVMIKTVEAGMVLYSEGVGDVRCVRSGRAT
jgi:hypothetical protein